MAFVPSQIFVDATERVPPMKKAIVYWLVPASPYGERFSEIKTR